MARMSICAVCVTIGGLLLAVGIVAASEKKPFTVTDMIEMTEIFEPVPASRGNAKPKFQFSPDGQRFVVVTRQGSLTSGSIEYRLQVFEASEVKAFVNGKQAGALPESRVLARATTAGSRPGIEQARWISNGEVGFIKREGENSAEIQVLDVRTQRAKVLVSESVEVHNYAMASEGQVAIYSATVLPDWSERNRRGYVVRGEMMHELAIDDPKDRSYQSAAFYLKRGGQGKPVRLDIPMSSEPTQIGTFPKVQTIWLSPDGKHAVILAPARAASADWEEYSLLGANLKQLEMTLGLNNVDRRTLLGALTAPTMFSKTSGLMNQFYLVDTTSGATKPLLDAPAPYSAGRAKVVWDHNGKSVIVMPTYVPLDGADPVERKRRVQERAIVEVGLLSGGVARVTDASIWDITSLEWLKSGSVCATRKRRLDVNATSQCYSRSNGVWQESGQSLPVQVGLEIDIREDMNNPPELRARDDGSDKQMVFTDLNPQLAGLTLGHESVFEWKDKFDRSFSGGVVYPPGYKPGTRYPVVLQVNDFSPNEFLVDGAAGMSTAYAARPLANKGILVLQLPGLPDAPPTVSGKFDWRVDSENQRFVAMIEGAIDALDDRGLIDPLRVGLIGFSRGGMNVLHALTFSKYPIAAATIAHSIQTTPWGYFSLAGLPPPQGMYAYEGENLIGAPFWGDGIRLWEERSPAFHLDQIRTPLRFEHIATAIPEYWDSYVNLKRHQRPVEMIHIPDGVHQLEPPFARYASQQGSVDWYAFWLNGEEDPDPAKKEQYERWRILRAQHERHMALLDQSKSEGKGVAH